MPIILKGDDALLLTERDLEQIESAGADRAPRKRSPAAASWDKAHLRTITTKLPVEMARRLQVVCLLERETPYRLLQGYLENWLRMAENRQLPADLIAARSICESLGWDYRRLRSSAMWNAWKRAY